MIDEYHIVIYANDLTFHTLKRFGRVISKFYSGSDDNSRWRQGAESLVYCVQQTIPTVCMTTLPIHTSPSSLDKDDIPCKPSFPPPIHLSLNSCEKIFCHTSIHFCCCNVNALPGVLNDRVMMSRKRARRTLITSMVFQSETAKRARFPSRMNTPAYIWT
jgi:hypothetical protein